MLSSLTMLSDDLKKKMNSALTGLGRKIRLNSALEKDCWRGMSEVEATVAEMNGAACDSMDKVVSGFNMIHMVVP